MKKTFINLVHCAVIMASAFFVGAAAGVEWGTIGAGILAAVAVLVSFFSYLFNKELG